MRIAIWPFVSQQDKSTGKFLPHTCGNCKQLAFIADALLERGHDVSVAMPYNPSRGESVSNFSGGCEVTYYPATPDNAMQRMNWPMPIIHGFFDGADVALLNHEYMAVPVRAAYPKLKIVQMCSVMPDDLPLFRAAWDRANLVIAQGEYAAWQISKYTETRVKHWSLAYDKRNFLPPMERDTDVMFVNRSSASNYTKHLEFMEAMQGAQLSTVYADPTGYLKLNFPHVHTVPPHMYYSQLRRTKVAVAFNANLYGGFSIREACYAGCTAVVLDDPCFDFPSYRTSLDGVYDAVKRALAKPILHDPKESYQENIGTVIADLEKL